MEMNENEWSVSNFVCEQYRGNVMKSFYENITIRPLFYNKRVEYIGVFWEF